jgi:hypothetical protein
MEVLRNFEVVLAQTLNYFVHNCHFVQCHTNLILLFSIGMMTA